MNTNKVWLDAIRDAVNRILESVEHTELAPYWWIDSMEDDAAIILHAVIRLEEQQRGLTLEEVMECVNAEVQHEPDRWRVRARLTAKLQGK